METLVAVAQHRNQYYNKSRAYGPVRFGLFGSPTSRDFRGINCRTFQSGVGILPTPLNSCTTPVTKRAFSSSFSPKTPSPAVSSHLQDDNRNAKRSVKSSVIPIPVKIEVDSYIEGSFNEYPCSELWAGPAYSNSPPPSSLPIPKFSMRPKRTVSLDLPASPYDIGLHPIAKSAPPSPTKEHDSSTRYLFSSADSATKTLRRILNLDISDD